MNNKKLNVPPAMIGLVNPSASDLVITYLITEAENNKIIDENNNFLIKQ